MPPRIAGSLFHLVRVAMTSAALALVQAGTAAAENPQRRVALVIGNGDYRDLSDLPEATADAAAMRDLLRHARFDVVYGENLDKRAMEASIRRFMRGIRPGDAAVVYYSGHAVQVAGGNYLLPVDAGLRSAYDLEVETQNLGNLLAYLGRTGGFQVAILDAAHANPFEDNRFNIGPAKNPLASEEGLAAEQPAGPGLILMSAEPRSVVPAHAAGANPFTRAVIGRGQTANLELRKLVDLIKGDVVAATGGSQRPWDAAKAGEPFYLLQRRQMLIVEAERRVEVPAGTASVALDIPAPLSTAETPPVITVTAVPQEGRTLAGERIIHSGDAMSPAEAATLRYEPSTDFKGETRLAYTVTDGSGATASSVVTIAAGAEGEVRPKLAILDAGKEQAQPIRVAFASQAGADFAPVAIDADRLSPLDGWMRLESSEQDVQLAIGDRLVGPGDFVKASEVAALQIRPSLLILDGNAEVTLKPALPQAETAPSITISVSVATNDCDRLAGEPYDLQGVVEGVLPNEIDVPAALAACTDAVRQHPDTPRLRFELGRALYASGDFAAATDAFRRAYAEGHVRAGQLIGRLYQLGAGVERDPAAAIPYFEEGAARGDAYAQNWLAKALLEGNGVKRDPERAIRLYAQAAEAGHTYAMNGLGAAYLYGRGVEKDAGRALRFFEASAARDDVWGYMNLGVMYRDGEGVEKDLGRARDLFFKAHEGGHPYAATALGLMERQRGGSAREQLGWFRQSANRGDAWGALHAAELLSANPDLAESDGERVRLFALALSHDVGKVSDRAAPALAASDPRLIGREIQRALKRAGADIGEVDGVVGAGTRRAAADVLGKSAPTDLDRMLVDLLRKEWIDSRPRLDML